jgi:hypothetical protein
MKGSSFTGQVNEFRTGKKARQHDACVNRGSTHRVCLANIPTAVKISRGRGRRGRESEDVPGFQ